MIKHCLLALTLLSQLLCASAACAADFNSGGVPIYYTIQGKGNPVILIHGLYSSALINWQLPGTIKALSAKYEVIAFDNRGHGRSGKPTAQDQYGTKMVDDVIALMDHLHIKKAKLVGYSLGGMIAMKLVVMHPERVDSVVLGGMGWLEPGSMEDRILASSRGEAKMGVPTACNQGMAKLAVTAGEVKAIKTPITVIVGQRDPCRTLYVQPLVRLRPDIKVMIVPGAGHLNCVTKPEFKSDLEAALARG